MKAEIISLENEDIKKIIIENTACPITKEELDGKLESIGFERDKEFEINFFWLLKSGDLVAGKEFLLASGNNPHQLMFPGFEITSSQSA